MLGALPYGIAGIQGASAAPWSPLNIPSIVARFKAVQADLTLVGSRATAQVNQVTLGPGIDDNGFADGPIYAANGTGLNNKPRLVFDGTQHWRNLTTSLISANAARTVAVVCRGSTTQGGALYTDRISQTYHGHYLYFVAGNTYAWSDGVASITYNSPPTIIDTDHLVMFFENGSGGLSVSIDGAAVTLSAATLPGNETGLDGFEISTAFAGAGFIGAIPEVNVFSADLSSDSANLALLKSYFASEYALTLS